MNFKKNLLYLRKKINKIDKKIILILAKRKKIIKKIAKIKIKNNFSIKDKKREKELLNFLLKIGKKKKIKKFFLKKIFKIIIKESRYIQKKILKKKKIFFLGPKGSYSYEAACKYIKKKKKKIKKINCKNFKIAIKKNENKLFHYTILPIENICSGYINEILNLLKKTNLFIINEINILIKHCLLVKKNTKIENIKNIYSHEQPIKQSNIFIKKYSKWNLNITKSTSQAMKKISLINKNNIAAIGNKKYCKIYNLYTLIKNISNKKNNTTRFVILSNKKIKINKNKKYKLTLFFTLKKKKKLIKIFLLLKKKKFNIKSLNKKNFFLEILIKAYTKNMKKILSQMILKTKKIKILGYYPINNNII
ncbi:prephenate dehydratase domain-containing protein [Buchnera aphidicola]|uniref:prephenate dehydratase domain-containing protein n=1 Tax=Buchnera aphidicola TaxID=9 RepID=UPI0031B86526